MERTFGIPEKYRNFARIATSLPTLSHIEMLIDIPEKKIYLNRAAAQTANVVQVRFSAFEPTATRPRLWGRKG